MRDITQKPKSCTKCMSVKEPHDFSTDKRASDGLQSQCRACQVSATAKRKAENLELEKAKRRNYYARTKSDFARRAAEFRKEHKTKISQEKKRYYQATKDDPERKNKAQSRRDAKREEKRAYDEKYRRDNQERCRENKKQWIANNREKRSAISKSYKARRRAICADGDPAALIFNWEQTALKVCHWCSSQCSDSYHVDHYQPLSKGGKHVVGNLVISCPSCNLRKNAKDPYEFAASMGRLF